MKHKLISAKVIADSVCPKGVRMTTMEIEYPRFILAELNTHRMLSKNSASSRAIPVKAMHEFIRANPATPVSWGKNQPGMKANEEVGSSVATEALQVWNRAKEDALHWADALAHKLAIHKQIANRITEPWMTMKTVISGTEWTNFFHLRNHPDAQPEIKALAEAMTVAYTTHLPLPLKPGDWHLPYITIAEYVPTGQLQYFDENFKFENENVYVEVKRPWLEKFDCEKGVEIAFKNKQKDTSYSGYVQAENLVNAFGIKRERIVVVPVPTNVLSKPVVLKTDRPKTIGLIGRIHQDRGIWEFIRLVRILNSSSKDFKVIVIGDGPSKVKFFKSSF